MSQQEKIFVLPDDFSITQVQPLVEQVKKLGKDEPIQIDCRQTRTFDSAGIAFINHLKSTRKTVSLLNLSPQFEDVFSMFPPLPASPKEPQPAKGGKAKVRAVAKTVTRRFEKVGGGVSKNLEKLKAFFILLTDEIFYTFQYLVTRRGIYPGEVWKQLFFMAYKSYPIVSLMSFLVGVTISITSAEQLRNFGADIYLADLVGFGMIRELVPLMTGIILAGKIGASITAEISSMIVLEETDALKTMGIIPEQFLMAPRLLAITMAIPLLISIADLVGIMGGFLVGKFFSGIPPIAFYNEMMTIVGLEDFLIGMGKAMCFGWLIVISSSFKGFTAERSPTGVGVATTQSVVLSISLIIIVDCIFALLLY